MSYKSESYQNTAATLISRLEKRGMRASTAPTAKKRPKPYAG